MNANNQGDMAMDANKDPDRLEREIDEQRREINETLRALEQKFSSQDVAGYVVDYFRGHGREWASNLGHSIKANPVPSLLTAIGVAWLMMGDRSGGYGRAYAYSARDYGAARDYGDYGAYEGDGTGAYSSSPDFQGESMGTYEGPSAMRGAAQSVRQKAGQLGDKAAGAREALGEKAAHMRERAAHMRESASHAREALGERAMHARDGLRSRAYSARQGVRHSSASVRSGFEQVAREQPLALGAIGIALGAILGAALPRTEREARVLGSASRQVKERGMQMAREGYSRASEKAAEMADIAKEKIHSTIETTRETTREKQLWQGDSDAGVESGSNAAAADGNASGASQQQPQRQGSAPGA